MSDEDSTKLCRGCDCVRPLSEFNRNRRRPDGLSDWCKPCTKAYNAKYRAANEERLRAHQAEYYAANRGQIRDRQAIYRAENVEVIRAQQQDWYWANRDEILARRTPESKERQRQSHKEWVKRNRDRMVEYENRRKARKKGATHQEQYRRQAIFERDGWICQLCDEPVEEKPTIDHIVPLSKGGFDTPDNVQLAHLTCNARKGTKTL